MVFHVHGVQVRFWKFFCAVLLTDNWLNRYAANLRDAKKLNHHSRENSAYVWPTTSHRSRIWMFCSIFSAAAWCHCGVIRYIIHVYLRKYRDRIEITFVELFYEGDDVLHG